MIATHASVRGAVFVALAKPVPPSRDAGLDFRQKVVYLETRVNVDPRKALALNPDVRSAPISALRSVESCLSSMGLCRKDRSRVLDMHPRLLTADPDLDLYPVLDFLINEAGIPYPQVRLSLVRCPRLLVCDVASQLRPTLKFLSELGFPPALRARNALLLVSSVELTLRPKLDFLRRRLGVSEADAAGMAVRSPGILTLSVEGNLVPKADYFLEEMGGDPDELLRFPQYFSFSLDKKIRPRHLALVAEGLSVPLSEMLKVSDGEFSARLLDRRLRTVVHFTEIDAN